MSAAGAVTAAAVASPAAVGERVARLDWAGIERSLRDWGWARTPALLTADECRDLIALYADGARFRSRVDMARYRFGEGEYKYLAYPLPPIIAALRAAAYPPLAAIARRWDADLGRPGQYPDDLAGFLAVCAARGQTRPTPLLLRYRHGGYNCLHQDLYGDVAFPLQLTCLLSRRGADFTGGESLIVEQRPRAQSRGDAIALEQGEGLLFATRDRPARGARGHYRAVIRHGVSRIVSGERYALGVIFHDAAP